MRIQTIASASIAMLAVCNMERTTQMTRWIPVHGTSAVAIMGAQIQFAGELPERPLKKLQSIATEAARDLGLTQVNPIQGLSIDVSSGAAQVAKQVGVVLNDISEIPSVAGINIDFAWQLQVASNQILFRTSRYPGWPAYKTAAEKILRPVLAILPDVIDIAAIRLEYLNRFSYEGKGSDKAAGLLLNSDPHIAHQIFDQIGSYHSNVGLGDQRDGMPFELRQVNVDISTGSLGGNLADKTLGAGVTFAREVRLPFEGLVEADYTYDMISDILDKQHTDIRQLFEAIISPAARPEIPLN